MIVTISHTAEDDKVLLFTASPRIITAKPLCRLACRAVLPLDIGRLVQSRDPATVGSVSCANPAVFLFYFYVLELFGQVFIRGSVLERRLA